MAIAGARHVGPGMRFESSRCWLSAAGAYCMGASDVLARACVLFPVRPDTRGRVLRDVADTRCGPLWERCASVLVVG